MDDGLLWAGIGWGVVALLTGWSVVAILTLALITTAFVKYGRDS